MAITVEELIWELRTRGYSSAANDFKNMESQSDRTGRAAEKMGERFRFAGLTITDMIVGIQAAIRGMREVAQAIAAVTGVAIAARFQVINIGFTTLIGNAEKARNLLKELQQMGQRTPFNTEELAGMARLFLSTGSVNTGVVREIRAVADAVAATGQGTDVVERMGLNLTQIRGMPRPELRDLKEFSRAGINLDRVVSAALGKTVAVGGGIQALQGMSGQKAFDTLVRGMEKAFGGSSERLGMGTFLGILQNIGETIQLVMLPTGQLLLPVVQGIGQAFLLLANAAQKVNELTGGGAGLIFLFRGLIAVKGILIGVLGRARSAITLLTESIDRLAASAATATAATATQATANTAASSTAIAAIGGTVAAGAAGASRFGKFASGLGRFAGGAAFIIPLVVEIVGNLIGDWMGGVRGAALKNLSTYGGIGAAIGSFGGPQGMAIGGGIGAIIGLIKTAFDNRSRSQDDVAKNTAETASVLKDIKAQMIGGGPRARRITSELEIEMALGRALKLGFM